MSSSCSAATASSSWTSSQPGASGTSRMRDSEGPSSTRRTFPAGPATRRIRETCLYPMACDDEIIPLQKRIEAVGEDADLQEVYDSERNLLYVACTRARDHLLVSGVSPASEFLDDVTDR